MSDVRAHTPLVGVLTPLRVALAAAEALAVGLEAVHTMLAGVSSLKDVRALENFAGVADGRNAANPIRGQASRSRLRVCRHILLALGAISTVVVRAVVKSSSDAEEREGANFDLTLSEGLA